MNNISEQSQAKNPWKIFSITIIILVVLIGAGYLLKQTLFPSAFNPVTLSSKETSTLNQKLQSLNLPTIHTTNKTNVAQTLTPQAYTEIGASREVSFSEKELNAMIAHNTDLADKLAIDLSNNLASARLLLPLDPDLPLFGEKTLKLSAGVEIDFGNSRPIVKLRGVSAWGVPIPNEWLGNLKNVDLIKEFGGHDGFWKSFSGGIDYIQVLDGKLLIKLKE
jgi:hypothetical protein